MKLTSKSSMMVQREPTVKDTRKKELRERIRMMLANKQKRLMVSEMMCTKDSGLKLVRDAASSRSSLAYSSLIQKFRELRIKQNNEKFKEN